MNQPPIETIDHHYAGVFLITDSNKVVGQRRDNKPTIDNPNKIGTFGGTVEPGEDAQAAAWRELVQEETNLKLEPSAVIHLFDDVAWRKLTDEWEVRHFYYAKVSDEELEGMEVYEGQGWAEIKSAEDPDLIELWRPATKRLFDMLAQL
ncbi:MAG: hydrolase [Patescibacteria group bacterium]|nr:hydrolase [Patescibacteria group bacterium]